MAKTGWAGVFPAITTQFDADLKIDFASTMSHLKFQLDAGVHGIIALGTCGENASLDAGEKRDVLAAIVETVKGKVPVLAGVTEFTTAAACAYACDCERIGLDGLMVLPAMVYVPKPEELVTHFR